MAANVQPVEQYQANAISIIDQVNVATVAATMQKIAQFQKVVQQTLKEGHDFGVVPGSNKPSMLKPGAEKILMLMGLTSEFEIVESVRDYENGFFAFTVRCKLMRNGIPITEGLGHCNTKEKRYTTVKREGKEPPDPFTLANTVLKMARKRALVDAALTVASLSDIFTQDLEDVEVGDEQAVRQPNHTQSTTQHTTQSSTRRTNGYSNGGKATDKQIGAIHGLAKRHGLDQVQLADYVQQLTGKTIDQLTSAEASKVISALNNYQAQQEVSATGEAANDDPFADVEELF